MLWKTAIPGTGHASPIVWGDKLFIVTALLDTQERVLLCVARTTGQILWQTTVLKSPLEKKHQLNSFASSTPATDGQTVYLTFLDLNEVLVGAYDFNGKQQWLVRPGPFSSMHGFCSSPLIYRDKLIVNADHDGTSYIVGLSRVDGKIAWKTMRENRTRSYCTPAHPGLGRQDSDASFGRQMRREL